jgi:hypothetical protein
LTPSRPVLGYVFGLRVASAFPIPVAAANGSGSRTASLELVSREALARAWRPREAESVLERRDPRGRLVLSIDRHDALGYLVSAPRHGRHIVSPDGRRVRAALPNVAPWRCHRLLFAQVLPLAATLQGLELFHASAVAVDGRGYGFIAPSGTGKTSVAAHLVARGATFVADDVLALEPHAGGIRVHPGGGMASVHASELRAIDPARRDRLGPVLGRSDKVQLAIELADRAVPLAALFFLERDPRASRLELVESEAPDPQPLLASSFISYVSTPERLTTHLEVCGRIAESVPVARVRIPASVTARGAAEAIESHLGEAA